MGRVDDVKSLISAHARRLQKLKEKQAMYGLQTPVETTIKIEDIETYCHTLPIR